MSNYYGYGPLTDAELEELIAAHDQATGAFNQSRTAAGRETARHLR